MLNIVLFFKKSILLTYESEMCNTSVFNQGGSALFLVFCSYLYTNHLYLFDLL